MSDPRMNATQITVPSKTGAQGDSIENYVLDRVSGDVEKNMGQVIEGALSGASVPVAAVIVLHGVTGVRRAFVGEVSELAGDLGHATQLTRRLAVEAALESVMASASDVTPLWMEVNDPMSTLKGKNWDIAGLTQTASVSGTSGIAAVDALFVPTRKSYTLAALVAKLEDLALTNACVAIFVSQAFPEVCVAVSPEEGSPSVDFEDYVFSSVLAQINGIFISESSESNPSFGFESGGGF